VPLLVGHWLHEVHDVRFAVASGLGAFADDRLAAGTLLALMQDANADIRDWATFGLRVLGSLGSDQIRTGLSERLIDTICDVREEALVGLAKRKDRQALLPLIAELGRPGVSRRSSRRPRNFWARIKPGWFKAPRFASAN
jgi:HEAT repeat protein